jgi:hypothetical protein
MPLDTFNIVAGIVTMISFVLSVILFIQDRALRRSLEAGLTGLIGTLDTLAYAAKGSDDSATSEITDAEVRLMVLAYAIASRSHAISLLKSFSNREERFKTYDFGLDGDTPQQRIQRRNERHLCAVTGQSVHTSEGVRLIDLLTPGDSVLSYDTQTGKYVNDEVLKVRAAQTDSYIRLNQALEVTASHRLWCSERGWIPADDVRVGDVLLTADGRGETVTSIELVTEPAKVFAVSVKTHACFFVGGYLAHNK